MKLHMEEGVMTTTVGELVAELLKFDQKALVFTEGSDCLGNVIEYSVGVTAEEDGSILIRRGVER